ncbi:MAG TPA: hypothetical protein DCZ95_08675 [Verrucomicrobia bacterium]|nr:hypothetical protein [Verrucomicrobiota bacterium]
MKHPHHAHQSKYPQPSHHANSLSGHPLAPAVRSCPTEMAFKPTQDEVARMAYEIYLMEGCPQGRDVQHWLEAETRMLV